MGSCSGFDSSRLHRKNVCARKNYIKMCINMRRFSPQSSQRTQSMSAFYSKYLRSNVISHLRSSALIPVSNCQGSFFAKTSAHIDSLDSRRVTIVRKPRGGYEDMGRRAALIFYENLGIQQRFMISRRIILMESARIDSVNSRRVTADVASGRLWGHGGAPHGIS